MGLFGKNKITKGAVADIIQCSLPQDEYIVWKWAPAGEDSSGLRADAIRYGSMLNVRAGETAAFFYNRADKQVEYVQGPVRNFAIETANLPVLAGIIGTGYGGGSPFSASIYFINTSDSIRVPFFIDDFFVMDCFTQYDLPATLKGTATFHIPDGSAFFEAFGMNDMDALALKERIRAVIAEKLKSEVSSASSTLHVPVMQLRSNLERLKKLAFDELRARLLDRYAIELWDLNIESLNIDTSHENYAFISARMREEGAKAVELAEKSRKLETGVADAQATQEVDRSWAAAAAATRDRALAENEILAARIEGERLRRMTDITLDNMEDTLRRQREEVQRSTRLGTESSHLAAHQVDVQGTVAHRAAESLGELGAAGGASMGGDGGMNVAGMMAGMMMGGAVGQNMASMMGGMTHHVAQPVPPPPPAAATTQYFVAVNGQQSGPYGLAQMAELIAAGRVTRQTYVWKQGMAAWDFAANVAELAQAFGAVPPPIPPQTPPAPPTL